jgi:lysophospholipase L1-like esterase
MSCTTSNKSVRRKVLIAVLLLGSLSVVPSAFAEPIVLIGDSQVARGNWAKLMGPETINRGRDGDTIRGTTQRAKHLRRLAPTAIVVMVGINDLGKGRAPAACTEDMRRLLTQLRAEVPEARMFVTSLLPVTGKHIRLTPQIEEVNRDFKTLCESGMCSYLDVATDFALTYLRPDGLHLRDEGYGHWASILRTAVLTREARL